jgi:hypothetical protein
MNSNSNAHVVKGPSRRTAICLLATASLLGASIPVAAEVPLAIKGYDPVGYFTDGKPTPGLPAVEHEWDGYRYRFARPEHRELFKADPVRYAPQFENFCAMALTRAELVEADPENWLISDGKLYVFGKPAPMGPALFQQDLAGNIAKANQNRTVIPKR